MAIVPPVLLSVLGIQHKTSVDSSLFRRVIAQVFWAMEELGSVLAFLKAYGVNLRGGAQELAFALFAKISRYRGTGGVICSRIRSKT
jgi:hypothetical protein